MIGKNKGENSDTPDVESLCNYFANSPLFLSQSISGSDGDFKQYLGPRILCNFNPDPVSHDTIISLIQNLPTKKATDPDKISLQKC